MYLMEMSREQVTFIKQSTSLIWLKMTDEAVIDGNLVIKIRSNQPVSVKVETNPMDFDQL